MPIFRDEKVSERVTVAPARGRDEGADRGALVVLRVGVDAEPLWRHEIEQLVEICQEALR